MAPLLNEQEFQKVFFYLQVNGRLVGFNRDAQHHLAMRSEYIQMMLAMAIRQGKSWTVITLPDILVEDVEILYILAGQADCASHYVQTRAFQSIDLTKFFLLLGYLIVPESHVLHIIKNFDFAKNDTLVEALFYLRFQLDWFVITDFLAHQLHIRIPLFRSFPLFERVVVYRIKEAEQNVPIFDESNFWTEMRRFVLEYERGHLHHMHTKDHCVSCHPRPKNLAMSKMSMLCRQANL